MVHCLSVVPGIAGRHSGQGGNLKVLCFHAQGAKRLSVVPEKELTPV